LAEIREAKLGVAFAQSIGISIDHRRHNRSQESLEANKKRLLAYVSKLVLYPLHADKAKKGLVADTTKEAIEKAQVGQSLTKTVLGVPNASKREKPQKITAELKNKKAYLTLRTELTRKKWAGKREKKAKEAEKRE